jgi:hypothetical protein
MRCQLAVIVIVLTASLASAAQEPNARPTMAWQAAAAKLAGSQPAVAVKKPGSHQMHYYTGDEQKLGEFLKLYASIPQPEHKLVIDGQWNAITDQPVEPFRYDWMLTVPFETSKSAVFNESYPTVHISANSDRIAWQYLVIPESLVIVPLAQGSATDQARSTVKGIMEAAAWSKGVAAWNEFSAKELGTIASEEHVRAPQWMEMRSAELTKLLGQYRIFALETSRIGRASTFAVDKTGTLRPLGSGQWSGREHEPFKNPELAGFLKGCHLKITTADDAISVAKLVEDLSAASSTIGFIKTNTRGFRILDRRFYGMLNESAHDWKYTAAHQKGYWVVKEEYIGPPANTMEPPRYHLVTDSNDMLVDIEDRRGSSLGR